MKHVPTIAAVAIWLAMMGVLAARQAPPTGLDPATLPAAPVEAPATAQEEWFGVYQAGRKIGHTRRVTDVVPGGRRFEDRSHLELVLLGSPQAIETTLIAETDEALRLRRFEFTLASAAATFSARGTSDDTHLGVAWGTGGDRQSLDLPLQRPIHLTGAMRPRIAAARPAPGTRYVHEVLSPLSLKHEPVSTTVEGVELRDGRPVLRLVEEQQGVSARVWLDPDGRVLREEGTLGLVLVAEPRAVATADVEPGAAPDLALATRIPLVGAIHDPRELAVLTLRVTGPAAAQVPDDPPRQRVRGGLLRIEREAVPPAGDAAGPDPRFLAPEPFVESDDPLVTARARRIVGDEADPERRARRLVRWVHDSMQQEPAATVPSAREVLRTLRGDCNEHAVLLAALARAAGLPARVVAGAMYADGAFFYHAWTEIWLGAWITADATLDQMPADVTHVKLVDGGPAQHVALATLLGRLGFEAVGQGT